MQRACAAALLKKGNTVIHNPGHSNDDKAALSILKALGAALEMGQNKITVKSSGQISNAAGKGRNYIDCGESGLSIRMFTPIAALSKNEIQINGSGSLAARPMDFFDEVLPKLGVSIKSNNGKLPLIIQGPLKPVDIEIDGSLSSQFLTGLLLAYSATGANDISIKVKNLKSRPYIDLTLDVMKQFGFSVPENKQYSEFIFRKRAESGLQAASTSYTVEGDWSGGAFLLVAGAIAGPITVRGLDLSSTQADKRIVDALLKANAGIAMEAKGIKIHPAKMNGFEFDATDSPDLFPPLVALAAYCNGTTTIKGVSRLTHKESNRSATLKNEFGKMGIQIDLEDDFMIIHGTKNCEGANVHSNHDHRIAMACGVAALKATGETEIEEAQAINKSYPDFYTDLQKLGAAVSLPVFNIPDDLLNI